MGFFGYAIVAALLALWFWWLEKRQKAVATRLAEAAERSDDDDDDDTDLERRRRLLRLSRAPLHALAVLFGAIAVVCLVLSFFRTVPTGSAAVPVTFGKAGGQVGPGLHVEWPITRMKNISVRTQSYTMAPKGDDASVQVLGQDGTVATADATLLYRVQRSKVSDVYTNIGTGYTTTIVKPTARTCVRAGFTKLPMITAATQSFQQVEADIDACIKEKLQPNGINVVDFQLRELRLSAQLQNAIDGQIAAKMLGVDSPLNDKYLQLYYLQVLQQFAKNGNSIVVTGGNTPGFTLPLPTTSTTTGK